MGAFKVVGVTLLLLLCHPVGNVLGVNSQHLEYFEDADMNGLLSLWAAWNTSTQHPESNLLNWGPLKEPFYPCYGSRNWRGVTCLRWQFNALQSFTWMVGLQLSNASIGGFLPPEINSFTHLTTLSLTGNPNLTGPLPKELAQIPLNILDLHDNGFNGTIPTELSYVGNPQEPSKIGNLIELDLSGNQFAGGFPTQFLQTFTLQVFSIARNQLNGTISLDAFENFTQLFTVDLSGNRFTGQPPNFSMLTTLDNLNLSYNDFTGLPGLSQIFSTGWLPNHQLGVLDLSGLKFGGQLPDWNSSRDLLSVGELYLNNINVSGVLDMVSMQSAINRTTNASNPTSRTLQVLSLTNNNITDVQFYKPSLLDQRIKLYLQGNPYCNDTSKDADGRRCFCEGYCAISPDPSNKSYWKVIVLTTSVCAFVLGSVILGLVFILHRKNKHVHSLLKIFKESEVSAKRFEYSVLRSATKNFAEERKLGEGAYGAVYKGILNNSAEIAVKQLFMKSQQANEDFLNEVLLITNLQHRNLVALKGYCLHGKEMLLVYEYVDFCDLDKLLFQDSSGPNMQQLVGWPARMNICLGVAQGLFYLHASSQTRIIHRDIKASNILLDKSLNPKIADFGLARPIEENEIITQQRAGTIGYLAPEYLLYGQLSEKADVYSFGVLLLEIVSGSRNKDPTQAEDEIYLPTRAWKLHREDRLMDIMDPRLQVSKDEELEVQRILETAISCVQASPEKRPTMFRVVAMVAGDANVEPVATGSSNIWPELLSPFRSGSEDPLILASSSTPGSSGRVPRFSNSSASIELGTRSSRL